MGYNLNEQAAWAVKFEPFFDAFYQSEQFREFCRSHFKRIPLNFTYELCRKDDPNDRLGFQRGVNGDVLVKFYNGFRLCVDEKVRNSRFINSDEFAVETVSVQPKEGDKTTQKKCGWAYKEGTVIVHCTSSLDGNSLVLDGVSRPLIYTITRNFRSDVVENNEFRTHQIPNTDPTTGVLKYWTIIKIVPRSILSQYIRG